MRIDKFLFFVRLAKTRALAQQIIEQGHVRIDGRPAARAHAEVRAGSVVALPLGDRVRVLRVAALPLRRGAAAEAQACYVDLSSAN